MRTRFRTADRKEKRGGNTWWALIAGEEVGKGLTTWGRAAAAVVHPVIADREGGGPQGRRRLCGSGIRACGCGTGGEEGGEEESVGRAWWPFVTYTRVTGQWAAPGGLFSLDGLHFEFRRAPAGEG